MTQISPDTWCERFQAKLMAGLEAAWAMIEDTDDPVVLRKATAKARACGTMASTARKIVLMTGPGDRPTFPPLSPSRSLTWTRPRRVLSGGLTGSGAGGVGDCEGAMSERGNRESVVLCGWEIGS